MRAGLSYVSGLVGLEYQKANIAVSLGLLGPLSFPDVDYSAYELGILSIDDEMRLSVAARYFLSPESNGLFGALSFMTNDDGYVFDDVSDDLESVKRITETYNAVRATVGYRLVFGERFDLTLGAGYGARLGLSDFAKAPAVTDDTGDVTGAGLESGAPSIDISLGFAIK